MVGKVTSSQKPSASVLPAIMGHSPYETPLTVLDRAIKCVDQGVDRLPGDEKYVEAAYWGNRLEDAILEAAVQQLASSDTTGLIHLTKEYPEPFDYQDILYCSLDGSMTAENETFTIKHEPERGIYLMSIDEEIEVTGMGILEAKLTRVAPQEKPDLYRGPIQLQAQMLCTGATWGAICTLYQGVELRLFVYKQNVQMQQEIIKVCSDFCRRVRDRDLYPAFSATEAVKKYPEPQFPKKIIDADTTLKEKIEQLAHIRSELKAYEALSHDLQLDIMEAMQDASECVAGRYKVTWPVRNIKAKPEQVKVIPAVAAEQKRGLTLKVEEL